LGALRGAVCLVVANVSARRAWLSILRFRRIGGAGHPGRLHQRSSASSCSTRLTAAITAIDLRKMVLIVGESGFQFYATGPLPIDVGNVSDRPLTRVDIVVQVRMNDGSAGTVGTIRLPIQPGSSAHMDLQIGSGAGTFASKSTVEVVVFIDAAEMSGCRYKPAQSWPLQIEK